ncbi:MAG: DUF4411 family protein [Ramlibacter sp.]|nr:DUF4411 family protein [Ramlibacter sp.]
MTYCFDTSSFIHAAVRAYPFKNVPSFWVKLRSLIDEGRLVCPRAVIKEIEQKDDDLHAWIKKCPPAMVVEHNDGIQAVVAEIMGHPEMAKLVDIERDRSTADPFVIGLAKTSGLILVTQEDLGKGKAPKIPNIANAMKIQHIKLVELMVREDWVL